MYRFASITLLLFVLQAGASIISLTSPSSSLTDENLSSISTSNASLAKRADYSNHYLYLPHNDINVNSEGGYPQQSTSSEDLSFGRNVPADYHLRDQPQAVRNADVNGKVAYPKYTPERGWCLYVDSLPRNPAESYLIVGMLNAFYYYGNGSG